MGNRQIRVGQLVAPFGPGSIYIDSKGVPLVVCGLDHWYEKRNPASGGNVDRSEFSLSEPRLAALLGVDTFFSPPDFRAPPRRREGRDAPAPPPNAGIYVPALRFPTWHQDSAGLMHKANLHRGSRTPWNWRPVRFVAICDAGHLCEFPWKQWIECKCAGNEHLHLNEKGGSDLGSIRIHCQSCPESSPGRRGKTLSGTTQKPEEGGQSAFQKVDINCPGSRPWLGEGGEQCDRPLVAALINQTNLYFPRTISSIFMPDMQQTDEKIIQLKTKIQEDPQVGVALSLWRNEDDRDSAVDLMRGRLKKRKIDCTDRQLWDSFESLFDPAPAVGPDVLTPEEGEDELLSFRRAEYNIIRTEIGTPHLRVVKSQVPEKLKPWIGRVNLVEKLRETRVFYGFDRLEQNHVLLAGMPDVAMNQLFLDPPQNHADRWLPGVEVFGEGIYLELKADRISAWREENKSWLKNRLSDGFIGRLAGERLALPPAVAATRGWASRFLLVHTFSHLLINQLVFECGYSTAALRERIYISDDAIAPMAGILIYTSAGDSEGTLGGLVRLGRPERLGPLVSRAMSHASWCSADPVCSENLGGQGSRGANLAACHACCLLPETSCETINHGLDRAIVVGTPSNRSPGFLAELNNDAVYSLA